MNTTLLRYATPYMTQCLGGCNELQEQANAPTAQHLFDASERHIQAIWFDAKWRPDTFQLTDGRTVQILDPGQWNLEAGPDFIHATCLINGKRCQGDVEIHISPNDWDHHKHATDPNYNAIILHVTWFATPVAQTLPQSVPHLAFAPQLAPHPEIFPFDAIPIGDYPYATCPTELRPCAKIFVGDDTALIALLQSAGYYRILQKTNRLQAHITALGNQPEQALYEEVMAAMGYKQNTAPFRRLAHDLPYTTLLPLTPIQRFAKLAGTAKLIPDNPTMRPIWDIWWQLANPSHPEMPYTWITHSLRPQNHPLKRIAAVSELLSGLMPALQKSYNDPKWFKSLTQALLDTHQTELAELFQSEALFIGEQRIHTLINNVLAPYLVLTDHLPVERLQHLPSEEPSSVLRETLYRLTGSAQARSSIPIRNGLIQQGLLQIFTDFCRNGRNICTHCPVPHWHALPYHT